MVRVGRSDRSRCHGWMACRQYATSTGSARPACDGWVDRHVHTRRHESFDVRLATLIARLQRTHDRRDPRSDSRRARVLRITSRQSSRPGDLGGGLYFGAVGAVGVPLAVGVAPGSVVVFVLEPVVRPAFQSAVRCGGFAVVSPGLPMAALALSWWAVATHPGTFAIAYIEQLPQRAGEQPCLRDTDASAAPSTTRRTCPCNASWNASVGLTGPPFTVSHR
jgi:hypothetical protein